MGVFDLIRGKKNRTGSRFSTRKHRLMRHSRHIAQEIFRTSAAFAAICLLTAIMIFLFNYAISSPCFRIRQTVVRGCHELTEKDVLTLAAVNPAHTLLTVNTAALRRRIMANPWVKEVYVGREFPDRLILEVRERKALALLERQDGFYVMDTDGSAFKKMESSDDVDVPVLTGFGAAGMADGHLLARAIDLLRCPMVSRTLPAAGSISEIHGDETLGISLFTGNGLCLQFGFDCFENKLKRLVPVMADLERNGITAGLLHIDLSEPTKITVQRKNVIHPVARRETPRETRTI